MKPPNPENEPFFSPEVLLVGEMHWHILRAAQLMYGKSIEIIKESGTDASKLVPMPHRNKLVPMPHRNKVLPASLRQRSTDFGREVGRDEINWWVFKKEREIETFRSETIKALKAAQSLKKSSEALKSKTYESYADLLQMLTQFAKDHDTDIKTLHQFVLWLAARDVLAPVILFTYRVWGSTRMGNREVKVDTNEPKASQDTIKSIAEVVFGLTNFLGTPVWTKAKYELNVEMWERAYEDEIANFIPEGQIVQRASAMAFEECAEYFELIRDSLRNILLDINKFERPLWTSALGLLSSVVLIGFWTLVRIPIPSHSQVHYPGELGGVMVTLLVVLAFSLAAALKGSRWWFLAATGLLVTIIVVVARLH